ncbi:MAG TPA: hypothetical protein VJT31_42650, partial [Rugosimonospora sp.]|nr:hypothetical protein [Rugosimonospora sp.]
VAVITVALAGPFTARAAREWGTLTGDPGAKIIALGRHDPAAVTINALRIAATVLATPSAAINGHTTGALNHLAAALHLPARDGRLTFTGLPFTITTLSYPDEDHSPYPIQALAVLAGIGYGLGRSGKVRGYAGATAAALLLTAALVAWQPWINRLVLPTFVASAPLAGWAAGDLLDRWRGRSGYRVVAGGLAVVVLLAGLGAARAVWSGQPRPLGGTGSVLTADREALRYARGRDRRAGYEAAGARLAASGARRIGVLESNVGWDYIWWVELRRHGVNPVLVSLTSVLPRHPPARIGSVDAAVCTLSRTDCARWLPAGWRLTAYPGVSVLLPDSAR